MVMIKKSPFGLPFGPKKRNNTGKNDSNSYDDGCYYADRDED